MKLSNIKVRERVKIIKINLPKKIKDRLKVLGFIEGVIVEVIRYAPLKDPMLIKLRNFYLAIRLSLADKISVEFYE